MEITSPRRIRGAEDGLGDAVAGGGKGAPGAKRGDECLRAGSGPG